MSHNPPHPSTTEIPAFAKRTGNRETTGKQVAQSSPCRPAGANSRTPSLKPVVKLQQVKIRPRRVMPVEGRIGIMQKPVAGPGLSPLQGTVATVPCHYHSSFTMKTVTIDFFPFYITKFRPGKKVRGA